MRNLGPLNCKNFPLRTATLLGILITGLQIGCGGLAGGSGATIAAAANGNVNVDFGGRSGNSAAIPPNMVAVNGGDFGPQNLTAYNMLTQVGVARVRVSAPLDVLYPTPTAPNWSGLDGYLGAIQQSRAKVMLVITNSPSFLQPAKNPCPALGSATAHAPPTDINAYAALAAGIVAHLDNTFPGLVDRYEIWNEPDTSFYFCTADSSSATHIRTFLQLYAAVAAAVHTQAQLDGAKVATGGPALADGTNPLGVSMWLKPFLSDPGTAPYVDFVTYHEYAGPVTDANAIAWDTGNPSMLSLTTKDPRDFQASYVHVASVVRAGAQPNASQTPILLSEYNTFTNASGDPFRNDPVYSPLWNALVVSELLNAAYASNSSVVSGMYYQVAGAIPAYHQCLLARIDPAMDCAWQAGEPLAAYPQYYTLSLLASPAYLDLAAGGHVASAISSGVASLHVAAFYTRSRDSVILINPSNTALSSIGLNLSNVGFASGAKVFSYLLDASMPSTPQRLVPTSINGSYNLQVTVPAHSVVGVVVQP